MGHKTPKASAGTTSVLAEMDRLIEELLEACNHFKSESRSGLVNLKSALKRARRLRNKISKKPEGLVSLQETVNAIDLIVSVTKLIYSILNCLKPQEDYRDSRVYYKNFANRRRPISDWIGRNTPYVEDILVTS